MNAIVGVVAFHGHGPWPCSGFTFGRMILENGLRFRSRYFLCARTFSSRSHEFWLFFEVFGRRFHANYSLTSHKVGPRIWVGKSKKIVRRKGTSKLEAAF